MTAPALSLARARARADDPRTLLIEADAARIEIVPLSGGVVLLAIDGNRLRVANARSIEVRRP